MRKKKICTIVGARPQFIKLAPLSREVRRFFKEVIVHTGQHYDYEMSRVFFDDLSLPIPDYNLGVGSGFHGKQTAAMLEGIEKVLIKEKPDYVLVYGDTNSTLAGALAAAKLHIPVAHVEAGLRSFNWRMPEEINRIVADRISALLFCPTHTAIRNLKKEGITKGVHLVGDVMFDSVLENIKIAEKKSEIISDLRLTKGGYLLATVHRAENTDDNQRLRSIIKALNLIKETIVLPLHPRTEATLKKNKIKLGRNVKPIKPAGYFDMLVLEKNAKMILTDSGGVQKEAYFFKVPCLTLRDETEWVETVKAGWNKVIGTDKKGILKMVRTFSVPGKTDNLFGQGNASKKIAQKLLSIN